MSTSSFVIRTTVDGAPLRLGQPVMILCRDDETADERFHGRRGVVSGYFADDVSMVAVEVDGLGEDWFFADELVEVTRRPRVGRAAVLSSAA